MVSKNGLKWKHRLTKDEKPLKNALKNARLLGDLSYIENKMLAHGAYSTKNAMIQDKKLDDKNMPDVEREALICLREEKKRLALEIATEVIKIKKNPKPKKGESVNEYEQRKFKEIRRKIHGSGHKNSA